MSKIAGFWKSLKAQIAGFWKSFHVSIKRNSKNIIQKFTNSFVNNQPRRYYKMHIILYSETNLKRIKLFKIVFQKNSENSSTQFNISGPISQFSWA